MCNSEGLLSPCDCTGTLGTVHKSCLEKWLSSSNTSYCELCHTEFTIERRPRPLTEVTQVNAFSHVCMAPPHFSIVYLYILYIFDNNCHYYCYLCHFYFCKVIYLFFIFDLSCLIVKLYMSQLRNYPNNAFKEVTLPLNSIVGHFFN